MNLFIVHYEMVVNGYMVKKEIHSLLCSWRKSSSKKFKLKSTRTFIHKSCTVGVVISIRRKWFTSNYKSRNEKTYAFPLNRKSRNGKPTRESRNGKPTRKSKNGKPTRKSRNRKPTHYHWSTTLLTLKLKGYQRLLAPF